MLTWFCCGCGNDRPPPLAQLPEAQLGFSTETPVGSTESGQVAVDEVPEWACRGYRPWKYIVIHHSSTRAGNASEFDKSHRARGFDGLGYHFVITNGRGGTDGAVQPGRRWRIQKWGAHTGRTPRNEYNNYGIGICLVGQFCETLPTRKQLASLESLTKYLCGRFNIAPSCVIGHRDAPGAETKCPGDKLHQYIHTVLRAELSGKRTAANPTP